MRPPGQYFRKIFIRASNLIPSPVLFRPSRIILPSYHTVSDEPLPHIQHLYKVKNKKEFIKDLDFLLKYFKPIDLMQLKAFVETNQKIPSNYFHLSFDDGLRECIEIIAPLLKEKGIPATFFLNSDFIDNKALMFRYKASLLINEIIESNNKDYKISDLLNITYPDRYKLDKTAEILEVDFNKFLSEHKPYMNSQEIQKLIKDGFTIGAHSIDHPEYSHIPLDEQINQTKTSIKYIANNFQLNYKTFAFPFTDEGVTRKFFDLIFAPSDPVVDLTFGGAGIKKDYHPFHIQRIPMEKKFLGPQIIKGEYIYYIFKALIGQNKIIRK